MPGRRPFAHLTEWERLGLLRLGLGVAVAAYAATFRATGSHPAGYTRPVGLALALIPIVGGGANLARLRWDPRRVAMVAFFADAAAVLVMLRLYALDPGRAVVALVLVVQGEGGVVLGLPGGVWAWAIIGAAFGVIEATSGRVAAMPGGPIEEAIPLAVGLLLALGGGMLSDQVLGERERRERERRGEVRRLAEAEARYRSLVEQIPVVPYIDAIDRTSSAIYISPRIEALLGYPPEDWTGDPELWQKLLHPEDRAWVMAEHLRTNASGEPFRAEYRMRARDGRIVWVRDEAVLLSDAAGAPVHWQGILSDVTEAKRAEERLAFLAYHDRLTGLPDRALFEQELNLALARARRQGAGVGLLFLDLDRFKEVNDRFGHAVGDEVLRAVAERLREALRETDLLTRHGGDEFGVIAGELGAGDAGRDPASFQVALGLIAKRIHAALAAPLTAGEEAIRISASIGVSVFPSSAPDGPSLLKQADAAMYEAKRAGAGGTRFFVPPE
jgi:diguanylate cyclase (GGDEF)-like protein/PAS domain S-box-containing protein